MRRPSVLRVIKILIFTFIVICILELSVISSYYILQNDKSSARPEAAEPRNMNNKTKMPTLVLLLSYQRTGSTYVCHLFYDTSLLHNKPPSRTAVVTGLAEDEGGRSRGVISDENSHVFFLYEPLDPLYTAMFGTEQGWNGAGDIFNDANGSVRILPQYELQAVTWYLEKIFRCQMADMPPGVLMHKFWNGFRGSMPLVDEYARCVAGRTNLSLDKWHLENSGCRKHIQKICGRDFGQGNADRQHGVCRRSLWGVDLDVDDYRPNAVRFADAPDAFPDDVGPEFRAYFRCMSRFTEATRSCAAEYFDKPCGAASIRAMKTVRATMDAVRYLHDRYPNLVAIHSFREPRALVNSRFHTSWAVSAYSRRNVTRIARNYCANVLRNSKILDQMSPNRTYRILYDDFVRHPLRNLLEVYAFLNRTIPTRTLELFVQKESEKGRYIRRADRWHHSLSKKDAGTVWRCCSRLISRVKDYKHFSQFFYK